MKVSLLSHSDFAGGAERAAYRLHHALRSNGIDSMMYVNSASADDWTVEGPSSKWRKGSNMLREQLGIVLSKALRTSNPIRHSLAILPSDWLHKINSSDAELLHMHWVNKEMLSIAEIGKLHKPLVWTLHDMWAFCGAEHLTEEFRWREGYSRENRPSYECGLDINRWTWNRKVKNWNRSMTIVTPSRWLADCARNSILMQDWPVFVVPNAIDTSIWKPIDQLLARELMHLPPDIPLLLFGAMGGTKYPHKGFDLLQAALMHLRGMMTGMELVIFGQNTPKSPPDLGFPVHFTGHLQDEVSLRLLYSAVDLMLIPSRQDNLPNTGVEAHSCGIPVVAFDACGLPDIVEHQKTGYLAKSFDSEDLARGIQWVLESSDRYAALCNAARSRAEQNWSYGVVVEQYLSVYKETLEKAG